MSEELKPCPFCGAHSDAVRAFPRSCDKETPYDASDRAFPIVRCLSCGSEAIGENWTEEATAIAKWNTRAPVAAVQGEAVATLWAIHFDGNENGGTPGYMNHWPLFKNKEAAEEEIRRVNASSGQYSARQVFIYTAPAVAGVPVEPTEAMLQAARNAECRVFGSLDTHNAAIWRAMLAAAPAAPSAQEGKVPDDAYERAFELSRRICKVAELRASDRRCEIVEAILYEALSGEASAAGVIGKLHGLCQWAVGKLHDTEDHESAAIVYEKSSALLNASPAPATVAVPTPEQVADELGMGAGAWDMVEPEKLIAAVLKLARISPAPVATEAVPHAYQYGTALMWPDELPDEDKREAMPLYTVAQGGGVDAEKVMALVDDHGWAFAAGRASKSLYAKQKAAKAELLREDIRALLTAPPAKESRDEVGTSTPMAGEAGKEGE